MASTLVVSTVAALYWRAGFQSLAGGDSGELAAEACAAGVAHPPGYPLFVLVGHGVLRLLRLLSHVAGGKLAALLTDDVTPILVLNRMCATFGLASAVLQFSTMQRLGAVVAPGISTAGRALLSVGVAVTTACAPLIWTYNTQTEVFALNNLCVASLLYVLVRAVEATAGSGSGSAGSGSSTCSGSDSIGSSSAVAIARAEASRRSHRWVCLFALASGLSLCNQHTAVLLIVPAAAYLVLLQAWLHGAAATARRLPAYIALGLAGLSLYAWLPLSHSLWRVRGSWGDASTLQGCLRHFLRADYGTFKLISKTDGKSAVEDAWARHAAYLRELRTLQLPQGVWLLAAIGVVAALAYASRGFGARSWQKQHAELGTNSPGSKAAASKIATNAGAGGKTGGKTVPAAGAASAAVPAGVADGATAAEEWCFRARSAVLALPMLLLLLLVVYLSVFHGLSNMPLGDKLLYGVHVRFWMQPTYIVTLLVGVGTLWLAQLIGAAAAALMPTAPREPAIASAKPAGAPATEAAAENEAAASADSARHKRAAGISSAVLAAAAAALLAASAQHTRAHWDLVDNSGNDAMVRYGAALLGNLPPNATLITGFDMQWTATRYLQQCEGVRPDVYLLNAPIMSFAWFAAHRASYPRLSFPGTHLVQHFAVTHASGGFSLADFFAANTAADAGRSIAASYMADKPHPAFEERPVLYPSEGPLAGVGPADSVRQETGSASTETAPLPVVPANYRPALFYAGVFVFHDDDHNLQFELRPHGLASRVVPRYRGAAHRLTTWRNITRSSARVGVDVGKPGASLASAEREIREAWHAWRTVEGARAVLHRSNASASQVTFTLSAAAADTTSLSPAPAGEAPSAASGTAAGVPVDRVGGTIGAGVVNLTKYDETTWEFATAVDTAQQGIAYGAWLLEWALAEPRGRGRGAAASSSSSSSALDYVNATAALEALYVLEASLAVQEAQGTTSLASTWKNIVSARRGGCEMVMRRRSMCPIVVVPAVLELLIAAKTTPHCAKACICRSFSFFLSTVTHAL